MLFREEGRNSVMVSFLRLLGVRPFKQEVPELGLCCCRVWGRLVSAARSAAQAASQEPALGATSAKGSHQASLMYPTKASVRF